METIDRTTELLQDFATKIRATVRAEIHDEITAAMTGALTSGPARRGRPPGVKNGGGVAATASTKPARRKVKMTPQLAAARKLQGAYLGSLKRLTGAKRNRIKAMAKKDGVAAAVKLAKKLIG